MIILGIIVALFTTIGVLAGTRPIERVASVQTPDKKHIHQIYAKNPIQAQFTANAQGLSGIGIARKELPHDTQAIIIHIYTDKNREIPSSITFSPSEIRLSFEAQAQSNRKQFLISIAAPNSDKQHALILPYESDSTKYPGNTVWQREIKKQGSLGITEYEKPTIAVLISRWLTLPHQKPLWIGVICCIVGFALRRTPAHSPLSKGEKYAVSSPHMRGGEVGSWRYYLIIFLAILTVYWPATKLFFYSDDIPILARIEVLKTTHPLALLLPYQYKEADPASHFGFDFYRPVSFTAYPFLLSLLPGPPNAALYYWCNIALFAITGCLLFTVMQYILQSNTAALFTTAFWAFHATKLGLIYWWSSSQDILASLFAMASIVFSIKGKNRLAIALYVLGMFSKEYVIVTPCIIAGIELLRDKNIKNISRPLRGFIIAAGIFLIVNTAMLGNPFMPQGNKVNTYSLTLQPIAIARNIFIYTSASVESRMWPRNTATQSIETWLSGTFELWRAKTAGPYYPGIVIIAGILGVLISTWKNVLLRNSILFGAAWWILYLGPILLFANDWKPRWLTLSIMGIGIIVAAIAKEIRMPKIVLILCSALIAIYGFAIARDANLTRFYREQSNYTRYAYSQLQEQEEQIHTTKRIIVVGIPPEQKTSLNAYLFRVYAKNPHTDIIYADTLPDNKRPSDVIINMSSIHPYYPESEK